MSMCGNAENALDMAVELSLRGGRLKPIKLCTQAEAEQEIEACSKLGARIISYEDEEYPELLLNIDDFPPIISVLGNINYLHQKTVAIVGSRIASINGSNFAHKLASDLGSHGFVIASGLARGIDTAAHKGALATGTVAVIAGGIDTIYPLENKDLYHNIAERGAIIAELPFGTVPRGQNFPQRNRIISGISYGVVIVEASFGSGSLITARMAIEQNKEIFAVPGFPLDPRSRGTNSLIKQGAKLTESAEDIIEELNILKNRENIVHEINHKFINCRLPLVPEQDLIKARKTITNLLNATPVAIEEVIKASGIELPVVLTVILELELAGKVKREMGNKISLVEFEEL